MTDHPPTSRLLARRRLRLSFQLKRDPEAEKVFGWVLEMWGYTLASTRLGVRHLVWPSFQTEPSALWHTQLDGAPHIYHYTFGLEFTADGLPAAGVGEWCAPSRRSAVCVSRSVSPRMCWRGEAAAAPQLRRRDDREAPAGARQVPRQAPFYGHLPAASARPTSTLRWQGCHHPHLCARNQTQPQRVRAQPKSAPAYGRAALWRRVATALSTHMQHDRRPSRTFMCVRTAALFNEAMSNISDWPAAAGSARGTKGWSDDAGEAGHMGVLTDVAYRRSALAQARVPLLNGLRSGVRAAS